MLVAGEGEEMRAAVYGDANSSYEMPLDRLLNSLVIVGILTEMLVHAANDWTNRDNSRYIIFNCHNSLWAQWHCTNMDHKTIVKMPPKRQSLSKGTWQLGKDDN